MSALPKQFLLFLFLTSLPLASLHACAVCFGSTDGNLIRGFTWGVAFLVTLPFLLMGALATFIIKTAKKNNLHE